MEPYSPFNRSISELQTSDLAVLSEVHEGWHVEFKRDRVPPKSLAKAISSFANTYGGWLFLGVEEQSSAPHTARSFPGIDNGEINAAVMQVRQSLNQHLHPVPYFESAVLCGPGADLNLPADRSIVVIHVPRSYSSPHIHSNGCIYIRVADSSEPQHLTDRHLLDQLWQRGDSIREETRRWIDRDPEFSKAEAEYPFLRLMFSPDLWHRKPRMHGLSLDQVRTAFDNNTPSLAHLPLDTVYPAASGFVARQTASSHPRQYCPTFNVYRDLSSDVILPLNQQVASAEGLSTLLGSKYLYSEHFVETLQAHQYFADEHQPELSIIDLNALFLLLMGVTVQYRAILDLANVRPDFHFKARVYHCWRKVPFLDVRHIIDRYAEYGVPMSLNEDITVPIGDGPDSFVLLDYVQESDEVASPHDAALSQAVRMFLELARAFGLSGLLGTDSKYAKSIGTELMAAGNRSIR